MKLPSIVASVAIIAGTSATPNATVSIDSSLTYLILPNYEGNLTSEFIETRTTNATVSSLFAAAQTSTFISYDAEFLSILGDHPTLTLVQERNYSFANEAGIWVPDRNEVWFTSSSIDETTFVYVLNTDTNEVYAPKLDTEPVNPNGGYSFDNKVYFAGDGNASVVPAIYEIDPATGHTAVIINSYFGLPFNGPNDMVWVKNQGPCKNQTFMFFTDDPLWSIYDGGPAPVLVDAVWRFDPVGKSLVPVISRADILVPNGIAVNKEMSKLYVTDTTPISTADAAANNSGSNAIFEFDINEEGWPVNKRLFGISRTGIPDGIKVDDRGRVWTGEGEGIVVRNNMGKVIGLFNAETLLVPGGQIPIANFALAGSTLVIEANERLWTVELAEVVVNGGRFYP